MDNQIVKHNEAIKATYRMSINEQRLMMLCITKIRRDGVNTGRKFTIRHDDFCVVFNTSGAYKDMRDAAKRLQQRIITINEPINIEGEIWDGGCISLLSSHFWHEGQGEIMLSFSNEFMPYLERLSRDFTRYNIKDIAAMKSVYAIRIYELVKMNYEQQKTNKEQAFLLLEVEEIRRMFELEDKYPRHESLRKKVLDIAVKEINEFSPLHVEYEQQKKGRRIHAIKFLITGKSTVKNIKSGSLAERKIQEVCDDIRKAFASGKSIKINGNKVVDIADNIVSFESGAGNLFALVKTKANVVSEQIETLF